VGQYRELSAVNEAIPPQIDLLIQDCLLSKERRVDSAKSFSGRLAGALRPLKPLSEVLAQGALHEVCSALEELSADELARLPAGQKALILAKLSDVVTRGNPELERASIDFLHLLLTRGILLEKEDYREIVKPGIEWGLAKELRTGTTGSDTVRRALIQAAEQARGDSHVVLQEETAGFLKNASLDDKPRWYLHSVRKILETLLANPSCESGASELAKSYKTIVRLQRPAPPNSALD